MWIPGVEICKILIGNQYGNPVNEWKVLDNSNASICFYLITTTMVSSTFSESTLHKYIEAALLCNSFKLKLLLRIYAFESFAFRMHKLVPPVCSCDVALESTQFATEMLFPCVNKHVYCQSCSLFGRKVTLAAFVGFLFWVNTHVSVHDTLRGTGVVTMAALKRLSFKDTSPLWTATVCFFRSELEIQEYLQSWHL